MVSVHKHNFARQCVSQHKTVKGEGHASQPLYQVSEGPRVQDPTGDRFFIVTDAGRALWHTVFVPIVNLLGLTPRKDFWLMPVHTGLSCHLQPTTPSPPQAALVHGEPALELAGTHITAY